MGKTNSKMVDLNSNYITVIHSIICNNAIIVITLNIAE